MIEIITKQNLIEHNYVVDNEGFFLRFVNAFEVPNFESIIATIDNAKVLDKDTGLIQTPFGLTEINKLSTGCKTALNISFILQHPEMNIKTVNVTECGYNALDVIFDMNINGVKLFLGHRDLIHKCKEHDYLVDGRYVNSLMFV